MLYGLVVIIRNWCYGAGIFKSRSFNTPIISVGNLDVGGSGKTPMAEYLIRLLKPDHKLATLSRGYGRKTKGWREVTTTSTASEVGDEPLQLKHKFPDVTVTVCEDRVLGAEYLQAVNPVILLDDAYQHRAIKPGLSILLFDYTRITGINLLLPAGYRREPFSGRRRADIIIITKCPVTLCAKKRAALMHKINPNPQQQVYFTTISYQELQGKNGVPTTGRIDKNTTVFLLTGIANTGSLYQYIAQQAGCLVHHKYPDHHRFTLKNIVKLAAQFEACTANKKIIITTEKDMQRLGEQELQPVVTRLPIYTLPIGVTFLNNGDGEFNTSVKNYVKQYTAHSGVH